MKKGITFVRYSSLPMKVRIKILQKVLINLGYNLNISGIRDRDTIKALKKFQKENGLSQNAVVCSKTYEILNIYNLSKNWSDNYD